MSLQNVLLLNFTFRHTIVLLSLVFGPSGQLVARSHDVLSFMDVLPSRYDIPSLFLVAVLLTGSKTVKTLKVCFTQFQLAPHTKQHSPCD